MSRTKAIFAGLLAGLVAGIAMTTAMLLLAWVFGIATPIVIIGDRISVFLPPGPFLSIMGKVGGYNHLKQLGVGSTIAGQVFVGVIAGAIFGLLVRRHFGKRATLARISIFVLAPTVVVALTLWPVLGTSYRGFPIDSARLITLIGLALCFFTFERTLVAGFQFLTRARRASEDREFSPAIGRRALVLSGIGLLVAGGGAAVLRKLYHAATFSYDGLQYKGRVVQSITPNDQFYCVTKNVVDPRVNVQLWHLEINGLVENPRVYRFGDLKEVRSVEQETTLMCISNGLDAGLISNAVWKGVAIHELLGPAVPLSHAARVRFCGVDNYTDTIPVE